MTEVILSVETIRLKDLLLSLNEVQYTITQTQFRVLFEDVSTHLWQKYTSVHRHNLLNFFANLDAEKKAIMCDYLLNYHQHGHKE